MVRPGEIGLIAPVDSALLRPLLRIPQPTRKLRTASQQGRSRLRGLCFARELRDDLRHLYQLDVTEKGRGHRINARRFRTTSRNHGIHRGSGK